MKAEGVAAASDMRRVTDGDMEELTTRLRQNGEMGPELITTLSQIGKYYTAQYTGISAASTGVLIAS
jgi:hypothetical protein